MIARILRNGILTADLAWGVVAMPLAYLARYGWVWHGPTDRTALIFVPPLLAALLLWSLMSTWVRLDGFRAGWLFSAVVSQLVLAVVALMCALLALAYLLGEYISRLALGYFGLLLFSGFLAIRVIARSVLASRRSRGLVSNVVIVGNGLLAREMAAKIESHPEMLRKVVGFLSPGEDAAGAPPYVRRDHATVVRTPDIAEMLKSSGVDELILTLPEPGHAEVVDLTSRCARLGIAVSMIPQPYELYVTKPELTDLDGLPLIGLQRGSFIGSEPFWKRPFDIAITLALLPVCIALILCGAALLKINKGQACCRERRCGKGGKEFWLYRLNSPRRGTDLAFFERLLQTLSITELPQLFNVLRGDMSLVGPRPEGTDRARHYTDWHRQRLNVKPGITGLAQVHGLRDQHSSEDKTRYDLQYILHRSAFQDVSLLLQTAWTLILRLAHAPAMGNAATSLDVEIEVQKDLVHAHSSQSSAD
jgi:lipopolysaccharide/colanic/teichoic acid biosynthesis glycosyltransferase